MKTFAIDIRLIGKKRTGDETVFLELTRELLRQDRGNRYLLMTDETDEEKKKKVRERLGTPEHPSVEIVTLRAANRFAWNLFAVPRFLRGRPVDVYHTQYILPFSVPRRTKVVMHVHDVSFAAYPHLIGFLDRLFLGLFIPRSLRRADLVVAPSAFTKSEITRYFGTAPEKIAVIPNAVGTGFLAESLRTIDPSALRQKYSLPEHFLLYVGTLQPRKNLPFLIRAFAGLKERLPQVSLVLVGSREGHHFDPGIDKAIAEHGLEESVVFPGYVDQEDLPGLMRLAQAFVFPSLYEGFGIPLLEAMSQGVAVAASDIPCLREVGGDAAVYFDPGNLATAQEKLYTLFTESSLREPLISLGKERVRAYSWEKSAALLVKEYQKLSSSEGS